MFSSYGHIESARILSDKDCAFINFESVKSALAAKKDLETRLGSKVGGSVVKVGFGKADVNLAVALTNEASPNVQGPTRALCK
jgi:RNA recognition motif-containing protein